MPRRNKYNRRRRRGSYAFLYRVITFVLICAAIAVALSLFFKVNSINISGNTQYSNTEILDSSGVKIGDNLYLLNKYQVAERITSSLPYIESVQIRRTLPDTLTISVTECTAPAAVLQDGSLYLISGGGKIVDSVLPDRAEEFTLIQGIRLVNPTIGKDIELDGETEYTLETLLSLLSSLSHRNMLADTQYIDLRDAISITMAYLNRFTVTLNWDSDFDYKLNYLLAVVDRLEINEVGTIDMTQDGKVSFIPQTAEPDLPTPSTTPNAENNNKDESQT